MSALNAHAEYISPDKVVVQTKNYFPEDSYVVPGNYKYRISWQGIPVANGNLDISRPDHDAPGYLKITARAETVKALSWLYHLTHRTEGSCKETTFQPHLFSTWQIENSREKWRRIEFAPDGMIHTVVGKKGGVDERLDFNPNNFTVDPVCGSLLARSLSIKVGAEASFDVFNGKHRFLISFKVLGQEKLKVQGVMRNAFKVLPSVKKLTDTEGEPRLRRVLIWISTDRSREILRLESEVFIGSIVAQLQSFQPLVQAPQPSTKPPAEAKNKAQSPS